MKKIGIIGGAGPLASALFYKQLTHECYRQQRPLPEMLLINYPFKRGCNGDNIRKELAHCIQVLNAGGATHGVLVCNTLHLILDKLPHGSLQFLRLPDLVLAEICGTQNKRLLLLGTHNTCRSQLYDHPDITVFRPSAEHQKLVNGVIDRILQGEIGVQDARLLEMVIHSYPEKIDGVILGCTELPVLHHHFPIQTNVAIYDSITIPSQTLVRSL